MLSFSPPSKFTSSSKAISFMAKTAIVYFAVAAFISFRNHHPTMSLS